MTTSTREQARSQTATYAELEDQAKALAEDHAKSLEQDLANTRERVDVKALENDRSVDHDDDIARIERRMDARRASFKQHLVDARASVGRTAKAWPIVAIGAVGAAIAVGVVVARQSTPTQRFAQRAREAPEAARRYIHRATRPSSAVWTERVARAAGFAVAVARVMPQLRALAAALPTRRRPR